MELTGDWRLNTGSAPRDDWVPYAEAVGGAPVMAAGRTWRERLVLTPNAADFPASQAPARGADEPSFGARRDG